MESIHDTTTVGAAQTAHAAAHYCRSERQPRRAALIDEGHTAQRIRADYGYDLVMLTYDEQGYAEPGLVFLQLKASETLARSAGNYPFELDVRDYNLWKIERLPVILVLFDAATRRAYWLHVQRYFEENPSRRPRQGARTVRVQIAHRQVVNRRAVARMRAQKEEVLARYEKGPKHV